MRKIIGLLLAVGVASTAIAAGNISWGETTMILTRAAPTLITEGLGLYNDTASNTAGDVAGFRVTVCAPAAQTLTGGAMRCWYRNNRLALWARCGGQDWTPTTGVRCAESGDFTVDVAAGRILYASDSITLSGAGTTVSVTIEAKTH